MYINKIKQCSVCDKNYEPTGRCSKYCLSCREAVSKERARKDSLAFAIKVGRIKNPGVGSGGAQGSGETHHTYKNGIAGYRKLALDSYPHICNRCKIDLDFSSKYKWCCHHKDHNRSNNSVDNIELLCKRCHQIEHECYKAFNIEPKV